MVNKVIVFIIVLSALLNFACSSLNDEEVDAYILGLKEQERDNFCFYGIGLQKSGAKSTGKSIVEASGKTKKKIISLTFDDGPFPLHTPMILEILKKHNIKATFFVNGIYARKFPQLIADIKNGGHEIGNHTYNHRDLRKLNYNQMSYELEETDRVIYNITGKRTVLVRPPGGRLDREVAKELKKRGYTIVMYSINPGDWWQRDPEKLRRFVTARLHNGGIILLHNGFIHTTRSLPRLIKDIKKKGYRFATVSQLAKEKGIYIPPRTGN